MDAKTLIDSITRQTTVLVAQIATAAGIRAPLAHLADQVFVDLARQLEGQGVRQKVAADMFGLALRTYQKKVQRLTESVAQRDRTLWETVVSYVSEQGQVTRAAIDHRFRRERDQDVASVLRDLTESGLLYATGSGPNTVYGITSELDRQTLRAGEQAQSATGFVWLTLYRQGPLTAAELSDALPYDPETIGQALAALVEDGRASQNEDGGYRSDHFLVPTGSEQGWEAAVFDHFQAMAVAIAHKLQAGQRCATPDDTLGGATLTFELHAGHPLRDEVLGQLRETRARLEALWDRVEAASQAAHPTGAASQTAQAPEEALERVTFYFGQHRTAAGPTDSEEAPLETQGED